MKLIEPSATLIAKTQLIGDNSLESPMKLIEQAGRTCYKSESKTSKDSWKPFVNMIKTKGHESVLEHVSATIRIICDRGVSHEIVRHRIASFSQESTRYCNYSSTKKSMTFVKPFWYSLPDVSSDKIAQFKEAMLLAEAAYNKLIALGSTPQEARAVLPNALKTEIVATMNLRSWKHFLELRLSPQAHPDMRIVARLIKDQLMFNFPVVFESEAQQ
jgi:thymidylate synthase (FAD)